MKKLQLIIFITLALSSIYGQDAVQIDRHEVSIDWQTKTRNYNNTQKVYLTFTNAQYLHDNLDLPIYRKNVDLIGGGKLTVELSNEVVEEFTSVSNESSIYLQKEFDIQPYVNQARDMFVGGYTLLPLRIREDGIVERLISADVIIYQSLRDPLSLRGPERTYNSVLSEGKIYKIAVDKSGVYELNRSDLVNIGVDLENLDPRKIGLFTNYGGHLPEVIADAYPDDLIELPIKVIGENDGRFDNEDKLFFYADGPSKWKLSTTYRFEHNIYDEKNFVFLKIKNDNGKRVQDIDQPISVEQLLDSYIDLQVYAFDRVNLLGINPATEGSGKEWYGDRLENTQPLNLTDKFNFNSASGMARVRGALAVRSSGRTTSSLSIDQNTLSVTHTSVSLTSTLGLYANRRSLSGEVEVNENTKVEISISGNNTAQGWLDYIEMEVPKTFPLTDQTIMRIDADSPFGSYGFTQVNEEFTYWDVTNLEQIGQLNPNQRILNFFHNSQDQKIVAFHENNTMKPMLLNELPNQNLHETEDIDMMVVYHPAFEEATDKFVEHRSAHSGLKVIKVNVYDIYNEFSSGRQDPSAIRDFVKMVLDRSDRFKYLLLMGDGTYDQRGIVPSIEDHRFIPVYETDVSLDPIRAFPTDDYYGLLSDNEGKGLNGALDVAVGRITCTTNAEAEGVVNKIIQYDTSPKRFGDWKLRTTFTADDEDTGTHFRQMDGIAREVNRNFPVINDEKVYFDAYRQETTPGGQRYPDVEAAFERSMDRGHLAFCYLGHGGPKGWAQERVLKVPDIQKWDNIDNQALIVTATCSFTGYDDPDVKSAGEYAILNPKGGTVALFTTVRAVFASENERLTSEVFKYLYSRKDDFQPLTFGDAITLAKNANKQDTTGENSRKFSLIGDPSQTLALPQYQVTVDEINEKNALTFTDTVGALDLVTIEGSIVDFNGRLIETFNGTIFPTIFDKRSVLRTLKNDSGSSIEDFEVLKNIIFKGTATVKDGKYKFSFVVPKDINYNVGYGKISLYATDGVSTDAAGYYDRLLVGGSNEVVVNDMPPIIEVYINSRSFTSGDEVASTSTLLLDLKDDLGINVTGTSIGHDLTASLEGPINMTYILNDFYKSALDDYTSGSVEFLLEDLPEGDYSLTIQVWDIGNNTTETTIYFTVISNNGDGIEITKAYPNPFTDNVTIEFTHDLGQVSQVNSSIALHTLDGKFLGEYEVPVAMGSSVGQISLNINNTTLSGLIGDQLLIYKINIVAPALGISRESQFNKLLRIE